MEVTDFNSLAVEDATTLLAGCLGVRRWVDELVAARPYESAPALRARAHDAACHLTDDELDAALSRHPRIGERPPTSGRTPRPAPPPASAPAPTPTRRASPAPSRPGWPTSTASGCAT